MVKAYVAGKGGKPFDPYKVVEKPTFSSRVGAGLTYLADRLAGRPDPRDIYRDNLAKPFTHGFQVATHTDLARFVEGRLDLMVRNGKAGLILVVVCLVLFLNWRVALWTAIGLPVSFLGTFIVMAMMGVSLNLLSMFGLIIVLGIIVDDAIVIGENIYRRVEEGMPAMKAAVFGGEEVLWPVVTAVSTTIAAFVPLMFIRGQIGDFMRQLPLVVIAALSVSLAEALLVLPAHLRHLPEHRQARHLEPTTLIGKFLVGLLHLQQSMLLGMTNAYRSILRMALTWRYVSLAVAVSACVMAFGLLLGKTPQGYTIGNLVKWEFVQKMDAESMYAQVEMPVGSTAETVEERLRFLAETAMRLPEVKSVSMDVASIMDIAAQGSVGGNNQSHLGQIWVELLAADEREANGLRSSEGVLAELRRNSETLTGVNSVKWEVMNGGPGGKDIEIRISGGNFDEILNVAQQFKAHLSGFDGVVDLDDDFDEGKRELQLTLRESARPAGMTLAALGNHVRAATYGAEARRITRNREDVKIMVRYPESFREDVYNIENMWLPTPSAGQADRGWIPMREVAVLNETRGFTQIHRSQQKRSVTVYGEIDAAVTRASDVLNKVRLEFVPEIERRHPSVKIEFLGSADESAKAFGSLAIAFPVAMLLIYTMLAALFKNYYQPLVVMAAIPFGVQGAIVGHWLTDNPMTILSMIGLVALTGIVVNDSLVLVDFINTRVREGMSEFDASLEGSILRLRPILLTTITTVAGLTPLMFEKSFQAKFLIPMAVTLTFGLMFATVLTLLIVPVLNLIFFDLQDRAAWIFSRGVYAAEPEPAPGPELMLS